MGIEMTTSGRLQSGLFGIVGSFAPSIIKMFNDLPNLAFLLSWQWAVVVTLYGLLGGLIAVIYPYRGPVTAWKALLIGVSFPSLIGTAAALARAAGPGTSLGGPTPQTGWTGLDFLALF
ncbi:hypothetical protein ABID58_006902 [Bradyrhizobium sp. S3.2.6]|uniref:hypothetical protein n=1 Tax=Bradyrhizobium sp. S3.2.6 TaxID=3156428 RepID=UPI003394A4DE